MFSSIREQRCSVLFIPCLVAAKPDGRRWRGILGTFSRSGEDESSDVCWKRGDCNLERGAGLVFLYHNTFFLSYSVITVIVLIFKKYSSREEEKDSITL